jgi:hypothetical protein
VIAPNPPKEPVALDVLRNYKVAVLLGSYPKNKVLAERLMEYVNNGGTLLLNIKQVNEFFPEKFLGFEKENEITKGPIHVRAPVSSIIEGKSFDLPENYLSESVIMKGASGLLKDANGNLLACLNRYGDGNVIVSTIDFMVPENNMVKQSGNVLSYMVYGKKFPFIEYFLKTIVSEVLPLEVKGDIYGLNKISNGWLVYLINNNGVTKFTNKEQILDMSRTAKVEVFLRKIKAFSITELVAPGTVSKDDKTNSITINVPPGEIRVIKIEVKD